MQKITARDNQKIKLAHSLEQKKFRDEKGLFLAEGVRNCEEVIKAGMSIQYGLFSQDLISSKRGSTLLQKLLDIGTDMYEVSGQFLAIAAATETPQGLVLVVKKHLLELEQVVAAAAGRAILILDAIRDPGNVGTILRTAWAANIGGVVVLPGCADIFSPKVVRSAMGGLYWLSCTITMPDIACAVLKKAGYRVVLTAANGTPLAEAELAGKLAWVFGNEAEGPGQFLCKQADDMVGIPIKNGVDSLNVAVAAGILLFADKIK